MNLNRKIFNLQPDIIMIINTNNISEKTKEIFNQEKFEEIIALLTDDVLAKILEEEKVN
jgi:hypothetical protein